MRISAFGPVSSGFCSARAKGSIRRKAAKNAGSIRTGTRTFLLKAMLNIFL
jgi:hypothetical protein